MTPTTPAPTLIEKLALEYPSPALPYYQFQAALKIDEPSMLDIQAYVDGQKMRFLTVKDADKPLDMDRPVIHYRPVFADVHITNTTLYKKPVVVGWLVWQPGKQYKVQVTIQKVAKVTKDGKDTFEKVGPILSASQTVTAPKDAKVFDPAWKNYKALVLSETAGVDRKNEPVDAVLAFYADEAGNLANDVRVVAVDPKTHAITEVPSQAYDIRHDVVEGDPRDRTTPTYARSTYDVQIWVPTMTARVAFQADVPARTSKVYLVYHNNPAAKAAEYKTDLSGSGLPPGLPAVDRFKGTLVVKNGFVMENDKIKVGLHPHAGVIDEVVLKSKGDQVLTHRMETNGSIHWAPEAYPPPRPWTHTSDWKEPKFDVWSGPVCVTTHARAPLPYIPEVDASVGYKLYAGLPYVIATTSMRVNEPLPVQAMRNGEVVFKRGLLSHMAWYDAVTDKIQTVNLDEVPDLNEVLMELNVPWISFFNPKTGIAFGGVQMEFAAAGLEHWPRVLNPYMYTIVGPVIYWSRAMNFTFASAANQLMVEAPTGTQFWEKWAFVLYEPAAGDNPHAPLLDWQKKLTNPLRVRLVEEAEARVPTVPTEIYIDPSKTGWEGRATAKEKQEKK